MKKIFSIAVISLLSLFSAHEASAVDIKGLLSNLAASDSPTIDKMAGSWVYASPAVSFKSDNLVKKAGGAAASTAVESKIEPFFKKAGLESMTVEIGADSTIVMKVKKVTLSGTMTPLEKDKSGANYAIKFKAAGKLPLGTINSFVTTSGTNTLSLTFDVSKLIAIVEKVASVSGSSAAKGVMSALKGYDGVTAGFKLSRNGAK